MSFCPGSGKIIYSSRHEAAAELRYVTRRRKQKGNTRLHPYFCVRCGGYHLGREKTKEKK